MASRQRSQTSLPPYSRRPTTGEQVLRVAPDFPLAVEAIQLVQEWFPGTSAGDAWEFIQQLAHLVRADVRSRPGTSNPHEGASRDRTQGRPEESESPLDIPEDSPMPDAL